MHTIVMIMNHYEQGDLVELSRRIDPDKQHMTFEELAEHYREKGEDFRGALYHAAARRWWQLEEKKQEVLR